jgi:ketosteroid isomerase-like protein
MLTQELANHFAQAWLDAWNSHDINKIISHYADGVVLISPIAGKLLGNPEVTGKKAVKSYFIKGLAAYPDLKFDLQEVLFGQQSIVLFYINQNGVKAGEFMQLDNEGRVIRMYAHYSD